VNLNRLIQIGIVEARKSNYKQKLSAIIFDKKSIVSCEHNIVNSHRRNLHPKKTQWPNSLHAEVLSILAAKTDLKGRSILVIRINNSDELRYSRPCDYCYAYLCEVGLKTLYYVDKDLKIRKEKL